MENDIPTGEITIHSTPSADAAFQMLDGRICHKRTPIENEHVPQGRYTVKLTNDLLGMEKTLDVDLNPQKKKQEFNDVRLEIKN
jgi:hypothetical protein